MALYYYDGNKFQRCLNTDTVSGLPLDKRVEDLTFFLEPGGNVNTLLSELKAIETCFYDIDEVPKLLYVLTHRGWELILSEDMNVRPKGLHTKESISILVKEVLNAVSNEVFNLQQRPFTDKIHSYENCIVNVKMVPKAVVDDKYQLSEISFSHGAHNDEVAISWPNTTSYSTKDKFNHTAIQFASQNNTEDVIINIVPE